MCRLPTAASLGAGDEGAGGGMTLHISEDETATVNLVLQSVDRAPLPNPRLESVTVSGRQADVHLIGANGLCACVHLEKNDGRWRVTGVDTT